MSADVAVVESGKTKQKKRVKKDKNAPKKPMSPFFCYQAVRRATLKAEQPTLNNTDIIKVSKLTTNPQNCPGLILVAFIARASSKMDWLAWVDARKIYVAIEIISLFIVAPKTPD